MAENPPLKRKAAFPLIFPFQSFTNSTTKKDFPLFENNSIESFFLHSKYNLVVEEKRKWINGKMRKGKETLFSVRHVILSWQRNGKCYVFTSRPLFPSLMDFILLSFRIFVIRDKKTSFALNWHGLNLIDFSSMSSLFSLCSCFKLTLHKKRGLNRYLCQSEP